MMEYIFVPPKNHKLPGWPIYLDHDHESPVLGMLRQKDPIAVTKIHDIWLHVRQHNGPIGWSPGVSANAQVLVPINSPQAQQYFQQQMRPQSITSSAEPMSYRELQKHQQWQQESQHKRPTSYGWQRARGKSKNYGEILEKRRHQLRQVDLSEHAALLEEWYELIKELDTVFRYGFRSAITPQPAGTGRKRSYSFLDLFKPTPADGTSGGHGTTERGSSATPTRRKSRSRSFTGLFTGSDIPPPPANLPHRDTASQKLVSNSARPSAPTREAARQEALKVLLRENAARRIARNRENAIPVHNMPAQKLSQEPGMAAVAGSLDEPTHSYRNEMDPLTHANHPMAPSTSTRIVAEAPDMHRAVVEQTHPHSQTHTSSSERSRGPATREDQPINVPLSQHGYATAQVQRRNGNSAVEPRPTLPGAPPARANHSPVAAPQLLVSADEFDSPREITSTDIEHLVAQRRDSDAASVTRKNIDSVVGRSKPHAHSTASLEGAGEPHFQAFTGEHTTAVNITPYPWTPDQSTRRSGGASSQQNSTATPTSRIPAPSGSVNATPLRSQDEDAHARRLRVAQGLARIRAAAGGGAPRLPEHDAYLQTLVKLRESDTVSLVHVDSLARVLAFDNVANQHLQMEHHARERQQLQEFEAAEAAVTSSVPVPTALPAATLPSGEIDTVFMNF